MAEIINEIFRHIEEILKVDYEAKWSLNIKEQNEDCSKSKFIFLMEFLQLLFDAIDALSEEIVNKQTILISIKNQKLLQKCFQLIVGFGISPCLISGLGISLSKRCISIKAPKHIVMDDEEKYELLVTCTDFFTRSYNIPVLRNIIVTFHLCDYLASLIQLSFAPLKKPGIYANFTMTEEMYEKLNIDKRKYKEIFQNLVNTCFQPKLMRELLVLHNDTDKKTPIFVKKVIAKEMSKRLIAPEGLLSMIRCFLETYGVDTGRDWIKINMICKIIITKHGNMNESDYLSNITTQLNQILMLHNVKYLEIAITIILNLYEKYPRNECVNNLKIAITQCFDTELLLSKSSSGTLVLSPQEVEHNINILHCVLCVVKFEWDNRILCSNLYVLYLLGMTHSKEEIKLKLRDIILKCLEILNETKMHNTVKTFLFGRVTSSLHLSAEPYEAGIGIKCKSEANHLKQQAFSYFIDLFNAASNHVVQKLLNICLHMVIDLNSRSNENRRKKMFTVEETAMLLNNYEENQADILQLLIEISSTPKTITALKSKPVIIIDFIQTLLLNNPVEKNDEYVTIALVLLNTILSNINTCTAVEQKLFDLVPALKKLAESGSDDNAILSKELLSLISTEYPKEVDSAYTRAMLDVNDDLLPVRAHGIMELTKLIDDNDPETISKRHYIFCLLQEQLKDPDSYIYLSAINAIASLATHCTEDVLTVLCKEFLQISKKEDTIQTDETEKSITELRVKVGDIVVKVTKRLGEMAIVHKATLLNTMLCVCRDADPLLRTSAFSNLAEVALVLNYKLGTIIYEILLCIWSTIETDKAVECRRAAVMVIASLLKGLNKTTLIELKDNLLPIYRSLTRLYKDDKEDSVVRLHAQIALEELNGIVDQLLTLELPMEKKIVINEPKDIVFK